MAIVIANGKRVEASAPCTVEDFLIGQKLFPKGVVVELNGEAVSPSEFGGKTVQPGDKIEIVKVVAGG
jgi:thiamine biosynthesis protein ThiS